MSGLPQQIYDYGKTEHRQTKAVRKALTKRPIEDEQTTKAKQKAMIKVTSPMCRTPTYAVVNLIEK